jgi:hypothetical protein
MGQHSQMHQITVTFSAHDDRLSGREITARGFQGLLFTLLNETDVSETIWLHSHLSPKPFSLVPLYTEDGDLAGVRLSSIVKRATELLLECWGHVRQNGRLLTLGKQKFWVRDVVSVAGPSFAELAATQPNTHLELRFLSPTALRQGPVSLLLPLPVNVFSWPMRVWQSFAPPTLALPGEWPDWCAQNIFVAQHQIKTATVAISRRESFTGFVGNVQFRAVTRHPEADLYLSVWQALAGLATFSGVGPKTTIGMGAVEVIR